MDYPHSHVTPYYNKTTGTFLVYIGFGDEHDEMYEMSADAHLPNGVCMFLGERGERPRPAQLPASEIPLGVLRAVVRIVARKTVDSLF
jgi:hypothetical protein